MSKLETRAETVADALRERVAQIEAISWNLDSAMSAAEKDRVGYRRHNAANRTGGANLAPGELEAALQAAESALAKLAAFAPAPPALATVDGATPWPLWSEPGKRTHEPRRAGR